ncbi:MAG: ATP-binding protein [Clostridia bacterium]
MFLKDIAARKNIQNIATLESIVKFMMDNVGNITSTNKICNTLNSNGRNISIHTVEDYIQALKDSYIIYEADRYDIKGKDYLKSLEKYYVVDIGLRNMLLNSKETNIGHLLENIVYLELLRRGYKVNIGKVGDEEVDFVASNMEDVMYYQVCASVLAEATLERELRPLNKITDHYPKYLLTLDVLPTATYNGIKRMNVIDWLLKNKE